MCSEPSNRRDRATLGLGHGDQDALDRMIPLVQQELHQIARRCMHGERAGGLSVEETASVLRVSPDTVKRDWRFAKAWLMPELRGEAGKADDR